MSSKSVTLKLLKYRVSKIKINFEKIRNLNK